MPCVFLNVMKNKIILVRKQIILTVAEKSCINLEQKWGGQLSVFISIFTQLDLITI